MEDILKALPQLAKDKQNENKNKGKQKIKLAFFKRSLLPFFNLSEWNQNATGIYLHKFQI